MATDIEEASSSSSVVVILRMMSACRCIVSIACSNFSSSLAHLWQPLLLEEMEEEEEEEEDLSLISASGVSLPFFSRILAAGWSPPPGKKNYFF